jgi:hypothetical protein
MVSISRFHLAATSALFLVSAVPALADCKAQAYGSGTGFNQSAAELAARTAWTSNAKNWYGLAYASWSKSQNKSSDTKKIKFGSWKSTFYANPCR